MFDGSVLRAATVQMTATEFANLTHRIVREHGRHELYLGRRVWFNPLAGNVASVTLRKITRTIGCR